MEEKVWLRLKTDTGNVALSFWAFGSLEKRGKSYRFEASKFRSNDM